MALLVVKRKKIKLCERVVIVTLCRSMHCRHNELIPSTADVLKRQRTLVELLNEKTFSKIPFHQFWVKFKVQICVLCACYQSAPLSTKPGSCTVMRKRSSCDNLMDYYSICCAADWIVCVSVWSSVTRAYIKQLNKASWPSSIYCSNTKRRRMTSLM